MSEHLPTPESGQATAARRYQAFLSRYPSSLAAKEAQMALRFRKHRGNRVTKLKDLMTVADELMAPAAPFTACSTGGRGCSACCWYPVSVCEPEIELIERHTGQKRSKVLHDSPPAFSTPCPFLDAGGTCSIYSVRPFRCRTHVSFDSTAHWCDGARMAKVSMPQLRFSELELAFDENRVDSPVFDIRQVFRSVKR